MIFTVLPNATLSAVTSSWKPTEKQVEEFVLKGPGQEDGILNEAVFGEELLLIRSQVLTSDKKRADILAIDRQGNGVIIELKRDEGLAGVETQALQYLAAFAPYRGSNFVRQFGNHSAEFEEKLRQFLGEVPIDNLNRHHRVILMARSFDRALFSMGKWFGSNGVAFRCIAYVPFAVGTERFVSFSVMFEQSPPEIFPLYFSSPIRQPATFWHNIGKADQQWWTFLVDQGQIPAGWENKRGDKGEELLRSYIDGDRIIAYAKGSGALGWGKLKSPQYQLVEKGSSQDRLGGDLLHRLSIEWSAVAGQLDDAIPAAKLRTEFDLYHPVSTSARIQHAKADKVIKMLDLRFKS
jgi:hypothetical protein